MVAAAKASTAGIPATKNAFSQLTEVVFVLSLFRLFSKASKSCSLFSLQFQVVAFQDYLRVLFYFRCWWVRFVHQPALSIISRICWKSVFVFQNSVWRTLVLAHHLVFFLSSSKKVSTSPMRSIIGLTAPAFI